MKEEIAEILQVIKKSAKGRATGFVIGNTSDLFPKGHYYLTPMRETQELLYAGVVVRDVTTATAIAKQIDGQVDYVFVDDEKKIREIYYGPNDAGNIEKTVRGIIKKSSLITYKGNDLTVEAVDALVCNLLPEVSGSRIAIIGMGNFGSKVALKLVERGVHVSVFRRDAKKLKKISEGLNQVKSEHTISQIVPAKNIASSTRGADIVIGVTNEKEVITKAMLAAASPDVILIDAGKGCFAKDVTSDPHYRIFRADVSIMQKHIFLGLIRTRAYFSKKLGRRYIPELDETLISTGLLANPGEIIVDDIEWPKVVIGIAASGGVLEKSSPKMKQRVSQIKKHLKMK
jgi:hypothetical protein